MEILTKKVTKKALIAQTLLDAGRWMSAVEIAEVIGVHKRMVQSVMSYVVHDPRFDIDSKPMPNPTYTKGVPMVTYYRCFAIYPRAPKIVVRKGSDEQPAIGVSDGSVQHLLRTHNPLWHQVLCHRFGAAA
ncbi:hypothetical protein Tola_0723 [Tolumonas auensis DSM 9187]|uniref:Uncharacterized protein n=2 Tax=Tolumonas TaxID=43947 RepID=C4LBB6_TOLAT|nr:hypothetical protein Tola_0723 [Tolumonas auensis DSM 9187]